MATITLKMDNALKQAFEIACEDMGIPMNVAFTVFAKRVARDRRIPFKITADPDPFYSENNLRAIEEAGKRVKKGCYIVKTIEELEAMEKV